MSEFIEQQSTEWVASHIAGAGVVMRRYGIASNSRMPLDVAAAAASVTPDELLAVMESRARRMAQRRPAVDHPYEFDLDLVEI